MLVNIPHNWIKSPMENHQLWTNQILQPSPHNALRPAMRIHGSVRSVFLSACRLSCCASCWALKRYRHTKKKTKRWSRNHPKLRYHELFFWMLLVLYVLCIYNPILLILRSYMVLYIYIIIIVIYIYIYTRFPKIGLPLKSSMLDWDFPL